ncbi:hypothetical protein PTSG_00472 [Salpingoeca rosetta]|uniref:MsrB domain-containing protein n=1 Tax=Salpingoeca rosetta (strain ATCC 50818 / BSB-021) TaxID=946362 RepID=F2TWK4_SALR5|nr:uncharacterized protein PTSG_00472 [Salpingoeca rosetta]EGD72450.1 hypothetical protein PTSG_00472 [Salpingoeca rosetta]|eukprot:XP_004999019.1 hypothetical protein PTSG_00472 [Salpingoeca rosetta]
MLLLPPPPLLSLAFRLVLLVVGSSCVLCCCEQDQEWCDALAVMSEGKPKGPVKGSEDIMKPKAFGTCPNPVQEPLKWNCNPELANKICAHNRHFAEHAGYFQETGFLKEVDRTKPTTYYDPITNKPLFVAPVGRTFEEFEKESKSHGWPSFRDDEVDWGNVRVLPDGEVVSTAGTHLGHNLPDRKGNRYCINLVCVAGRGPSEDGAAPSS